jgi:ribonuclease I
MLQTITDQLANVSGGYTKRQEARMRTMDNHAACVGNAQQQYFTAVDAANARVQSGPGERRGGVLDMLQAGRDFGRELRDCNQIYFGKKR